MHNKKYKASYNVSIFQSVYAFRTLRTHRVICLKCSSYLLVVVVAAYLM